jgi:hypothetical protein
LTTQRPHVWRIAAAFLWIVSIVCLFKAIGGAVTAEESLNNPYLTAADRVSIQRESEVANRWAIVGWVLQFATAAVLSFGVSFRRVVRRIFASLGVLIAVDGITLLLMAVIIR